LKTTDRVFIENNICSIHDGIINKLIATEDHLIHNGAMKLVPAFEDLIAETRKAKEKGIKIETRLKKYFYAIRSLGFTRDKDWEDIEIINNELVIRNDSVNKWKAEFEELEKLCVLK
jgi:hypothetical protein